MDDPLRQKSVPLAAETVLWFEFLIDPSLLIAYLNRPGNGGPTAIELISQFLAKPSSAPHPVSVQSVSATVVSAAADAQQSPTSPPTTPLPADTSYAGFSAADACAAFLAIGRKQLAQKIITLKVASHLRWDLAVLERGLPLLKQVQYLEEHFIPPHSGLTQLVA